MKYKAGDAVPTDIAGGASAATFGVDVYVERASNGRITVRALAPDGDGALFMSSDTIDLQPNVSLQGYIAQRRDSNTWARPMTDTQKDEALRLVDRLIREWVDDKIHSETAMFDLRDGMAKLGVPKYFGAKHAKANT